MGIARIAAAGVYATTLAAAFLLWGAAASAQSIPAAQSRPEPSDEAIIVVGRDLPDIVKLRKLTREITPIQSADQPIARFADPICVITSGLPKPYLLQVADRMLADATEAGIRLAGEQCKPNIAVFFVDDSRAELVRLQSGRSTIVGGISPADLRALLADRGPVHVVSNSAIRGQDGSPIYIGSETGLPTLSLTHASRIIVPVRRDIMSTVVLIDRAALKGLTTIQIADYTAMRAFAMVRPANATGGDTILTLFASGATTHPTELTGFDRAYLKALYAGAANQRPNAKVADMARRIDRTLHGVPQR